MSSNVSRDTFIPSRSYQELIFSQNRPVLDAELNEWQDIYWRREQVIEKSGIGNGAIGDGYSVLASGSPNSILIYQGTYYNDGIELTLFNNVLLTGLTTPVGNRTDLAYIEYFTEEIDGTQDPNIIDPVIGIETAVRNKLTINIKVAEGVAIPQPATGKTHVQIATLSRLSGNPNITTGMITDDRKKASRNFVITGLRPEHTGGLTYSITAGDVFVANQKFSFGGFAGAIPAGTTRYAYIDQAGALQIAASLPTTFNTPIAKFVASGVTIITLTDLRMFSNLATDTPRIDVSINIDGTFKEGVVSLDNINILRPHEQTPQNMTIFIEGGTFISSNGQGAITFAGGSSPVFALPVGNPKVDVLTIDDFGNLAIVPGTPSGVPIPPTYPVDKQVIAEVTINPADSQIPDSQIRDVRFFLNLGGGPGIQVSRDDFTSAAGQRIYTFTFTYNPGSEDLMVFSSGQLQTPNFDYLETSSNTVTFINGRQNGERVSAIRITGGGGGPGGAPQLYQLNTMVGGETVINIISGNYTPGNNSLRVFKNGKKLTVPNDYSEPSGTQVILAVPATAGDVYEFIVESGGTGGGAATQPRSMPVQSFSADPTAAPSAGIISGAVSGAVTIDTIDFSPLIEQRVKFTVASPRDINLGGTHAVSLQFWGTSGFTTQFGATAFIRVRYAVLDNGDDVLTGGNRATFSTTINPFGATANAVHYVDLQLNPAHFNSNTAFIAFEFERDPAQPGDTYNDVFRLCEMRFKYVSA